MPRLSQGDVFQTVEASRNQLAIVFGHIGFNDMRQRWSAFSRRRPQLAHIRDPFTETPNRPVSVADGTWLWFVPAEENDGMADGRLTAVLDAALSWACAQRIASVATNGIANTDHSGDTAHDRQSDDQRARFLIAHASAAENKYGITIELINLVDIYTRNRQ